MNRIASRRGVSLMQVLTLLVAMSSGVWLGAQYLGVPVNDLAYTALDETELLEQMPDDWRPHKPGCPDGDCVEPTPEETASQLRDELKLLRAEAVALRKAAAGNVQALETIVGAAALEQNKLRRDKTIAYWERLCEIAKGVAYLHDEVAVTASNETTGYVLDLRRRAFAYGARAIESIPSQHVDSQAVESGHRLGRWYLNGAELYDRAATVWERRTTDAPTSVIEASLENHQRQHRQEAELIREKATRVSEVLSRRYVIEFPKLGV